MAKNRVVTDSPRRTKDNFFKKSHKSFYKPKFQHKNEENKVTPSTESNNFFVRSNDPGTSNTKVSKIQVFQEKNDPKIDKKPFDKKKYRLQKYSKKYQVQQWEDKRKKAVLRSYYKTLKEDPPNKTNMVDENYVNKIDDVDKDDSNSQNTLNTEDSVDPKEVPAPENSKRKRTKPFRKAHQEFQRIQEEKEKKKELLSQKKKEKEEARQKYKKKKIEVFKKLNKKTKKGQPIMKDRMEMLLEKIQNSIKQE